MHPRLNATMFSRDTASYQRCKRLRVASVVPELRSKGIYICPTVGDRGQLHLRTSDIKMDKQPLECVRLRGFTAATQGFLSFGPSALCSFRNL